MSNKSKAFDKYSFFYPGTEDCSFCAFLPTCRAFGTASGEENTFLTRQFRKINMLLLIFVGQKLNITDHISVYESRALFFFYFYPVSLDGGNLSLDAE